MEEVAGGNASVLQNIIQSIPKNSSNYTENPEKFKKDPHTLVFKVGEASGFDFNDKKN